MPGQCPLYRRCRRHRSQNGTSEPGEMPARRYPMRGPDEGVFGDLNQEIQRNTNLVRHSLAGLLGLAVAHLCDQSTRELQRLRFIAIFPCGSMRDAVSTASSSARLTLPVAGKATCADANIRAMTGSSPPPGTAALPSLDWTSNRRFPSSALAYTFHRGKSAAVCLARAIGRLHCVSAWKKDPV